jgi:hypothetical protein
MDELFSMIVAFSPAGHPRLKAYVFWKLLNCVGEGKRVESLHRVLKACKLKFADLKYEQQLIEMFSGKTKKFELVLNDKLQQRRRFRSSKASQSACSAVWEIARLMQHCIWVTDHWTHRMSLTSRR